MSNDPTLSVTVLSYNNGEYITDCLASIERQGIDSFEVFVVDDCSTDNSVQVINDFIKDRPNYTLITNEKNSGGAVSSQIGVAKSRGKYLSIIDSDDIVADGAYCRLIARIEKDGSDFAAGMPIRLNSGYMFSFLTNENENSVFAEDAVLTEDSEKARYCYHACYWDCVFKAEFLKNNNIHMQSGLLYADRPFLFDAVFKAEKISIDHNIVYYWRNKKNPYSKSITDMRTESKGILDRCESFKAQIAVTLDNADRAGSLSLGIWENSFERLYYPLNKMIKDNVDEEILEQSCELYRQLLDEYKGFFLHLLDGGDIPSLYAFYTINILRGKYGEIAKLAGSEDLGRDIEDLVAMESDNEVKKMLVRDYVDFGIVRVTEEKGRLFAYVYIANKSRRHIIVDKIIAVSRYLYPVIYDIEYDNIRDRFELSGIPETAYDLMIVYSEYGERRMKEFDKRTKGAIPLHFEMEDRLVTSSRAGGNPISVIKKNIYTFIRRDDQVMIYANNKQKLKRLFFFNMYDNKMEDLLQEHEQLYLIDKTRLHNGSNILLAETADGVFSTVSKFQFTNSTIQMREYKSLFKMNRIEIVIP